MAFRLVVVESSRTAGKSTTIAKFDDARHTTCIFTLALTMWAWYFRRRNVDMCAEEDSSEWRPLFLVDKKLAKGKWRILRDEFCQHRKGWLRCFIYSEIFLPGN